jgi:cytochrome c556
LKLGNLIAVSAGLALVAGGVANAEFSPKEAIAARISAYRETGAAFKTIRDQLKSDTPLKIMLRTSAKRIQTTAHDQYTWFVPGSGPEAGVKTKALPKIWTDPEGFKVVQARFQKEADLMVQVVDSGDTAAIKTQAQALGEACGACHKVYRTAD